MSYKRLMEVMDFEGDTNFKIPFSKLTKKFGGEYIEYLKDAFQVKGDLSNEEFCRLNHCPISFLSS